MVAGWRGQSDYRRTLGLWLWPRSPMGTAETQDWPQQEYQRRHRDFSSQVSPASLSSSRMPIHPPSKARNCCRMGIRAAGLTGALPLLACVPPVTEHLLPHAMGKLLYAKCSSLTWDLISALSCYCLSFISYLTKEKCRDLNLAHMFPRYTEYFLWARWHHSHLGDSGIFA